MMNKREKAKEKLLKAYRAYLEAKLELVKETGWNFTTSQTLATVATEEAERNELVRKMNALELELNK